MPLFQVRAAGKVVGSTMLEHGDPSMGIAFGAFKANENYAVLREHQEQTLQGQPLLIQVELQGPDGTFVRCQAACIRDLPGNFDPKIPEVEALGIPYPLYEQLFPGHVRAYAERFS